MSPGWKLRRPPGCLVWLALAVSATGTGAGLGSWVDITWIGFVVGILVYFFGAVILGRAGLIDNFELGCAFLGWMVVCFLLLEAVERAQEVARKRQVKQAIPTSSPAPQQP